MNTLPGDPVQSGTKILPPAVAENIKVKWGLDKPVGERYVLYLKNVVLHGQFGESYKTPGVTANQIIKERFPASARLGIQAVAFGLVIGLILGIVAALKRNSWADYLTIFIAIVGVSVPSFVFAALLQKGLGGSFFPIVGWAEAGMNPAEGLRLSLIHI